MSQSGESILYAQLPDDIVVIQVRGKGNHQNSVSLREAIKLTSAPERSPRYIFDLEKCETMDSTFMGVMASVALQQQRQAGGKPVALNMNAHVRELLNTLGLKYVLDMRDGAGAAQPINELKGELKEDRFEAAPHPTLDKINRIVMMIEAHEKLIDIDGENEVKFKGVLQSLRDSLKRARDE